MIKAGKGAHFLMVKSIRWFLLFLLTAACLSACNPAKTGYSPSGLEGWVTRADIEALSDWQTDLAVGQELDGELIGDVEKLQDGSELLVFINLQSSDSRNMAQRVFRLMDEAGYSQAVRFFNLEKENEKLTEPVAIWKVKDYPTLLVVRNGLEVGRISGTPDEDFENVVVEALREPSPSEFKEG